MKRVLMGVALVMGCGLSSFQSVVAQKADIDYVDPATKKNATVSGQIADETNAGIKLKDGKLIPALAIVHVVYHIDQVDKITYNRPFSKENTALAPATKPALRKSLLATALGELQQLEKDTRSQANVFRYIQYRIVQLKVLQAQDEPENKALMRTALDALKEYKTAHPNGWEYIPCLTLSAKIYEGQGDTDAALEVYKALLEIPDLSKEMRRESEMLSAQLLVRKKRYQEAETKFKSIAATLSNDDPQKALIQLYLVESQLAQNKTDTVEAPLLAVLQATSDAKVKATAHNFLGDYYRKTKRDEDALWHYLKVDTLYSQDKDEHAKALYYLSKLFETVQGNKVRAQQCQERLTDKAYAGNEYYQKAVNEKPAEK